MDFKGFQHALRELEIEVHKTPVWCAMHATTPAHTPITPKYPQIPVEKALDVFKRIDTDNSGIVTFKVLCLYPARRASLSRLIHPSKP